MNNDLSSKNAFRYDDEIKKTIHMKKSLTISLMAFCLCFFSFTVKSQENKVGFSTKKLKRIDSMISNYISNGQIPGATALIVKNKDTVYYKSFGYSNIEQKLPMKNDNIYGIASMTKLITSISALILYEKGFFKINDKLSDYLPEFKNMKVFVKKDGKTVIEDAQKDILIIDLFRHTSGLKYGSKEYSKAGINPAKINSLAEFVKKLSTVPLYSEPGIKFEYSYSTDVLGYLVEKISGQSLQQFFKENIFQPLEMTDTDFYVPKDKLNRMVSFYEYKNKKLVLMESNNNTRYKQLPKVFSGGGGLVSTTKDYSKVLQMLLNGGRYNNKQIISKKTVELMTTDHLANIQKKGFLRDGRGHGLGVGLIPDASKFKGAFSDGSIFWSGIRNTYYWVDLKENMYGIIMTQVTPYKHLPFGKQFRSLTYDALVK